MSVRNLFAVVGLVAAGAWSPALAQSAAGSAGQSGSSQSSSGGAASADMPHAKGEEQGPGKQAQARPGELKSVVGTVQNLTEDTLTLRNRLNETHDFALDDQTKFTEGGRSISRDQISEGQEVRAAFRSDGGTLHATEIKVQGGSQQGGGESSGMQQQSGSPPAGASQQGMGSPEKAPGGTSQESGSTGSSSPAGSGSGSSGHAK